MRKDTLPDLNKEKKEGVVKLGKKFIVRLKVKNRIISIKGFTLESDANVYYNQCLSGEIIPNVEWDRNKNKF